MYLSEQVPGTHDKMVVTRSDETALTEPDLEALRSPHAYPHDASAAAGVEHVQTHISHVFLTARRVYKFRKAVDLGFVDFTTRRARNDDCEREMRLNRRLAADVYLGIAPLVGTGRDISVGVAVEQAATAGECCVVMRRLPTGRDAASMLGRGCLDATRIDLVAQKIAQLHDAEGLGRPAPFSRQAWEQRIHGPVEDNFRALAGGDRVDLDIVERTERAARLLRAALSDAFERRRIDGRAVDGHGDLHLAHVWFEDETSEPAVIDCLEFNDDLRRIDAASDVAFLAMDLIYRGAEPLAERFLDHYANTRDDHQLYEVVDYYVSYRAAVRAKVAALAAGDDEIDEQQRNAARASAHRHLALAETSLAGVPLPGAPLTRGPRLVVVMTGTVGSGKSTVARALTERLRGPCIASDRVRKRVFAADSPDLYTPENRDRVYDGMLERAGAVVRSGRSVVLDATYERRELRDQVAAWCSERGIEPWLVETRAGRVEALRRLAERSARANDPSDAGPDELAGSLTRYEPPLEWPAERHVIVDTDRTSWHERVDAIVDTATARSTRG
jgi:hypothetical protein